MNKGAKIVIIGGVIYLGYKGYQYVQNLKRIEEQVVITTNAKKDKITLQGVTLLVEYNIKNPTGAYLKMSPPLIRILIEKTQVATSNMNSVEIPAEYRDSQNRIVIRPNQETGNIATYLTIPWIALAGLAPEIIKRLNTADTGTKDNPNKIDVEIELKATVFTLAGSLPYASTSKFKV